MSGKTVAEDLKSEKKPKLSGVVLVAAPKSGIDSLTRIFADLPAGLDASFIVLVPGYPDSPDKLGDILGQASGLKTKVAAPKDRIEARTIHILPADRVSTIKKSRLVIEEESSSQRGLIDSFLLSLVGDQGEKSIGIILSGLNGDGSLGLAAVKESGGLAVAELMERTAPNAANPTGIVDHLLPRDQIVERLTSHLAHRTDIADRQERLQAKIEELESTNKELKSSNEEHQSVNAELQSANEELQSTNSDLKNLLESTQIATILLDNEFRIKSFTPAVAEIFRLIDSDVGRPIVHIAPRIAYEHLQVDVRKVLRTLNTVEREVEDASSGTRYLVRVLPYRSAENFIAGVVLTFLDVTATAQAEKALMESEERFRNIAQTVPAFLFIATPDLEWQYVNPAFYQYTGLPEGEGLETRWLSVLHPDDARDYRRLLALSTQTGSPVELEFRLRDASGAYQWFLGKIEAIMSPAGQVSQWFGSCINIHARKMAENRQNLLLIELQHRVKNILAVVRSLANRTAESAETLEDFTAHFDGRLSAMGRTQNILVRTPEGAVDLAELIHEELVGLAAHFDNQVDVSGPEIKLRAKPAQTLGLAVHELATNAVKYGALSTRSGHIKVSWRVDERVGDPRLTLEWLESGVPVIDQEPARSGFGRELIERGLPYDLRANTALEFRQGGVRCVIELPLDDKTAIREKEG